jgi:hypothetical protein
MFNSALSVSVPQGKTDLLGIFESIERAAQPTVGDLLFAGQRQRTRILKRTEDGVDVDGKTFAAYSKNGPYYYYPGKTSKNRKAAVTRFAKKIGLAGIHGAVAKRSGLGIRFASYGAFKKSLGRKNVDLRGPSAPHMLQALIVKVGGVVLPGVSEFSTGLTQGAVESAGGGSATKASDIVLGIYGPEAVRANAHNQGGGHLPKRKFFGASEHDKTQVLEDIMVRVATRVRKVLGNK